MKKKKSIAKLRSEAVTLYNKILRIKQADEWGYILCITCGDRKHWKNCDAGHFKHGLDFVEDNQHPQCKPCNSWGSGKLDIYTLWMIDKYGRERVEELEVMSKRGHIFSRSELEEKIAELKKELAGLDKPPDIM